MAQIEKELSQKSFASNTFKATLNIMFTSNWIRTQSAEFFKRYGILQQHYNVLRIVRGRKGAPVSPGEIIKVMLDKGRDLTRLVDKLVELKYLGRKTSELNRRVVEIRITEKGLAVTKVIEDEILKWMQENLNITETDAQELNRILDKMRT